MSNNVMQQVRTSVTGRVANSTTVPFSGQIGINVLDGRAFSTNGTNYFEIGGNVATCNVSTTLNVGNSTSNLIANSLSVTLGPVFIVANGTNTAGKVLTSGGGTTNDYWSTPAGGGGTPGGANTQIQYDASGAFAGDANLTWTTTTATLAVTGTISSPYSPISTKTANYTTVNTDAGSIIYVSNTTGATVTVSNTMPANSRFLITQLGAGQVTIANQTGQSLLSRTGAATIQNQYGSASVLIVNSSVFILDGNLSNTVVAAATPTSSIQFNNGGALSGDANLTWSTAGAFLTIGNSTVNSTSNSTTDVWAGTAAVGNISINSSVISIGNSTVNSISNSTTDLWAGTAAVGNITINSSVISIGNSTVNSVSNSTTDVWSSTATIGNSSINTTIISVGNSIQNTQSSIAGLLVRTATSNTTANTTEFFIGNTTSSTLINSTAIVCVGTQVNIGTTTHAANGFTWLPNGLKMNFGVVVCNTITTNVVYTSAFATLCVGVYVTPANGTAFTGANTPFVNAFSVTNASIKSASTTTTANVFWMALGF